jgi:HK97 family phage portal protein
MNIFGRKSAGRAVSRPASFGLGFGQAFASAAPVLGEWPRSYERQVRELYLTNAVAQRAVRLVAEGVASVPVSATDPAAAALVATTSGGQSLMETLAMQLLLHGNGYVQLLSDPNGQPAELYALRPERMSVVPDARGWPSGFIYRSGADAVRIPVAEIIHIRTNHPLDDHYGLGCLGAASGPIAIHNAATKWNKALLDNAARPSGALVYDPGDPGATLSRDQFDRLKTEMEASFSGAMNAGKPMLLEGGLKWQSMSLSPTDMDFIGLKSAAARDIALAFGVPPMLLGLPGDATFANYREANKALFRLAILPLAGKILNAIAQGLRTWFPELALTIDMDQVGALAEDRERLWAQVSAADFLTLEEKRALVGYERAGGAEVTDATQLKFNQNHDPSNGQFTFGAGGHAGPSDAAHLAKKPTIVSVDPMTNSRTYSDGHLTMTLDAAPLERIPATVSEAGLKIIKKFEVSILHPYVPKGSTTSGVTIGYGYDMGSRLSASALADLKAAGVDPVTAATLAGGAGKKGSSAATFAADNRTTATITQGQADALLAIEAPRHGLRVLNDIKHPLTQQQFDALASLHYNYPKATRGKIASLIRQGKLLDAAAEFDKYVHDHTTDPKTGKRILRILGGLVERRAAEKKLFLGK